MHRLIPAIATLRGLKVTEIPVAHHERKHGSSGYFLLRYRGILDLLSLAFSTAHRLRPFHLACEIAFFFFLFGLFFLLIWLSLSYDGSYGSFGEYAFLTLLGFFGVWFFLIGTILPFWGFMLDVESSQIHNSDWRKAYIKRQLEKRSQEK